MIRRGVCVFCVTLMRFHNENLRNQVSYLDSLVYDNLENPEICIMEIALLGLPKSGKTTVFNALTGSTAATSAFASSKAEPNIAVVKVPDARVDQLSEMYQPKKTTYATVKYVDVAGIGGDGSMETRGVPEALLQHVCKGDALIAVVRGFDDDMSGAPNPANEAESIH